MSEMPSAGCPGLDGDICRYGYSVDGVFVLILSFAEFNVPKFKQISGSLKEAFGVQKVVPVVEQPKGTTVIELNFSPNPDPAITDTLRQETTELQKPELELKTETEKTPEGEGGKEQGNSGSENFMGENSEVMDANELAKQLKKAIDTGEVTVETLGENVVINFPEEKLLTRILAL